MKLSPKTALPALFLGTALALGACTPADKDRGEAAPSAAAAPASDSTPTVDTPNVEHEGMPGMDGQAAASKEMDRVMKEAMAMPMTMSGEVDKDFASMMTMHHQTAIKMIDAYEPSGQAGELKSLAAKMKADQQEEIKKLAPFAGAAGSMAGHEGMAGMQSEGSTALDRVMKDAMAMPMTMTMSGNADKDFASMMTMHHQTAIKMIDVLQANGKSAELKALGAKMKAAQQDEINKMESFTR